jgi:hypothetical protein
MKEKFSFDDLTSRVSEAACRTERYGNPHYSKAEFVSCLPEKNMTLREVSDLLEDLIRDSLVNFRKYQSKFFHTDSAGNWYITIPEECRTLLATYAGDIAKVNGSGYNFEERFKKEIKKLRKKKINDELFITGPGKLTYWDFSYYDYKTPINELTSEERKAFYGHFGIEASKK